MKETSPTGQWVDVTDIRCPVCNGPLNHKWFNFRNKDIVEFIAECWSGDTSKDKPRHIFFFQIEVPECIIIHNEGDKK